MVRAAYSCLSETAHTGTTLWASTTSMGQSRPWAAPARHLLLDAQGVEIRDHGHGLEVPGQEDHLPAGLARQEHETQAQGAAAPRGLAQSPDHEVVLPEPRAQETAAGHAEGRHQGTTGRKGQVPGVEHGPVVVHALIAAQPPDHRARAFPALTHAAHALGMDRAHALPPSPEGGRREQDAPWSLKDSGPESTRHPVSPATARSMPRSMPGNSQAWNGAMAHQ